MLVEEHVATEELLFAIVWFNLEVLEKFYLLL